MNNARNFFARPVVRALLTLMSGAVMALSAPPTALWPLLFVCLSSFYVLLSPLQGWRAFLSGWLFGFGYFLIGLYWIGNALLVPGNEFKWVWPLAIVGLPIGLAIFTGLAALAATRWGDFKTWRGYCVFVFCLMASEWLRGNILTGFPWNLYGYAWGHSPAMVQSASVFGVYGLTFLTALWACVPGALYLQRAKPAQWAVSGLIVILSMAALYGWGAMRLKDHPVQERNDVIVRVVQPNIPQQDKANPDLLIPNLRKLIEASAAPFVPGKTYAIIWPETAVSDYVMQDANVSDFIRKALMYDGANHFIIAGTLRHEDTADGKTSYYNSLVTYDNRLQPVSSYDKAHLVPFGEYIPFKDHIPLHPFVRFAGFTPGKGIATQSVSTLPPYSGLVCYEVIFQGEVSVNTPRPAWMINVTNDGWYGNSPGPYQHLTMAVFRAVEEGIPLIRSANTGISAIIDPYGRITKRIEYGVAGYADSPLPAAAAGTWFNIFGRYIILLWMGILFGLIFALRKPY
ncbi:MAG: Apolipoprotein N-acyltransferase / Copper homeostasis protein CutE [Micavibrio sp.]|nr:Apolipoprotein N-acyltransferase / Copper homeostasis protein CutE [Micavibrio sp.]